MTSSNIIIMNTIPLIIILYCYYDLKITMSHVQMICSLNESVMSIANGVIFYAIHSNREIGDSIKPVFTKTFVAA